MAEDTRTTERAPIATEAPPAEERRPPLTGRRRTIALVVVLTGFLMDLLDITIVNIALPSIHKGIGADASTLQWLVAGYALAFASTLITFGRLGDVVGVRRMFLIGVLGFTIASLLAGLAQTPEQLIVLRFIQGAMGAAMVPQVYTLIQVMYAPEERGRAFAGMSAALAVGTVGGPLVGALLTTANIAGLGWRAIFLVNVPIGIAAFLLARALLPESKSPDAPRLDIVGAILITIAVLLVIYPLVQGREHDWPSWVWASIAASAVFFVAFVVHQRSRRDSPLVPMSLFKHRSFNAGLFVVFLFQGAVMSFFLVITIYLQLGVGYSILRTGLAGLPWDIGVPLLGFITSWIITGKLGRAGMQLGLVLLIVSMFMFMWVVDRNPDVPMWQLILPMFVGGAGMGMTFPPLMGYSLKDVPGNEAGSASGVVNANYQIGVALGIAACGTLFFSLLAGQAAPAADRVTPALRADLAAAGVPAGHADRLVAGLRTCLTDQMSASDPTAPAPACDPAPYLEGLAPEVAADVSRIWAERTTDAGQIVFQGSLIRTLWYSVISFALALLGSFLLPRR